MFCLLPAKPFRHIVKNNESLTLKHQNEVIKLMKFDFFTIITMEARKVFTINEKSPTF